MRRRKNTLHEMMPDFKPQEVFQDEKEEEYKEPDTWTIITALDRVLDLAEDSHLSDEFWEAVKNPSAFLRKELGMTNMQIVALAMLIEAGESLSWRKMGNFVGCSRLSMMVYSEEIEELVTKRWAIRRVVAIYQATLRA